RRQLELERGVAALVLAQLRPVEPGRRLPVGGADDQEDALPLPGRGDLDGARVPCDWRRVRNAGELRSPGERHRDGQREGGVALLPGLGQPLVLRVEADLPGAATFQPGRALEVWARLL